MDFTQSGSRITAAGHDGYGNAAVLDGQVSGDPIVLTRAGMNLTIRVQGNPRLLDGTIDTGVSNDCRPRRYTCNRH